MRLIERNILVVALLAAFAASAVVTTARADTPVDRFLENLDAETTVPAAAREMIRESWSKCTDCDGDEFLSQALSVFSPKFREGLDAYDAESYARCATIMHDLAADSNPFVATHAAVYEIKALVAMDRPIEAGRLIERVLFAIDGDTNAAIDVSAYSYFGPEVAFLRGFCRLADLKYQAAAEALDEFLTTYPEASPRLVIAAQQMLTELKNREPERIGDVVDLMNYSGRLLGRGDAGSTVQERQHKIIDLLDQLIEDAEQQEKNSSSSSSSGGSNSGRQGGQTPSQPLQQSMLPGGQASQGPLRGHRRANPGEKWGSMPPAQRERILQALRDSFPSRYRQLVEQYYEELAKKP